MPVDLARADAVADTLVRTAKAMRGLRHHLPKPAAGVDHSAYPVLFALTAGPARISSVAETIGSDISTVSRQAAQLLDAGLAIKTADPDDGRAHLVELTEAGHEAVARSRDLRAQYFRTVLDDWTPDEADELVVALERVRAGLAATVPSEDAPAPR